MGEGYEKTKPWHLFIFKFGLIYYLMFNSDSYNIYVWREGEEPFHFIG